MAENRYIPSDAAQAASAYFNALPVEERKKLAPLLEHHRQMGLAEAAGYLRPTLRQIDSRIGAIRSTGNQPSQED